MAVIAANGGQPTTNKDVAIVKATAALGLLARIGRHRLGIVLERLRAAFPTLGWPGWG